VLSRPRALPACRSRARNSKPLLEHVDAAVAANGCDHTPAATDDWAAREGIDLERLHQGLEEYGGFCDCEILMNVDVDEVFTPVRVPRG
jgi:hypothetical protein